MPELPYRFENIKGSNGLTITSIIKDFTIEGKKSTVLVPVNPSIKITDSNASTIKEQYALELETKAIQKRAEFFSTIYSYEFLTPELVLQVETIRGFHQRIREFLTFSEFEAYEHDFELHYVHGTTFIEGNNLTLNEVGQVIDQGINPEKKTLREINEVQNYIRVKKYRDNFKGNITISFLKHLHELIMNNIDIESAGVFRRTDDIRIAGSDIIPIPSMKIKTELEDRIQNFYGKIADNFFPFEQIIFFHYQFEISHPFIDGNGRVGREILNYLLSQY